MKREQLIHLVTGAQSGDPKALNDLFNAFYNDVYYFALKTLKDEDLACDITQETFVKIIDTIGTLNEPAAFVTWMKQITYNLCLGYFKKKKDVLVDEEEDGYSIFDTLEEDRTEFIPDEALDQQDFRNTILAMLDSLSPEQRAATMLYYYDELSVKQIAQIQGVSEGTVKSRLNYARKAIKASVEEYEKKNNVKLHSVGLFPLMAWLLSNAGGAGMSAASAAAVAAGITAATGTTIAVTGGTAAAGAGLLSALVTIPLSAKIAAAVIAGAVIIGSVGVVATSSPAPTTPTDAIMQEHTAPSLPPEVPASTEHQVTEPEATEPTETTPTETEPAQTESTQTEPPETEPAQTEPTTATEPTETEPVASDRIVPSGCSYVTADGVTIQPGEAMPDTVSDGDKFITGDYTYEYTYGLMTSYEGPGWSVTVNDTAKTSYEPILSQINGKTVISLAFAFMGCKNMTTAPAIPGSVVTLDRAFDGCQSLIHAPDIPAGVVNLSQAFASCTSLQTVPTLPAGVTNMWQAFYGCESLTSAPAIPSGVTDLNETFTYCISLQTAPAIPEGVTTMNRTFAECWSLTTAPVIPGSVTSLQGAFEGCTALTQAPVIPCNVWSVRMTFSGCTSLTEAPAIPESVTDMYAAFSGCSSLRSAPDIPSGVVNMTKTFYNCGSLSGEIVIHANPTSYNKCFQDTKGAITLTGSSTVLAELAATATNGNVTVK